MPPVEASSTDAINPQSPRSKATPASGSKGNGGKDRKSKKKSKKDKLLMPSTLRVRRNYSIYQEYVRQDYQKCLQLIEKQLRDTEGRCEYPIYVKALIKRQQGQVAESLQLFQAAAALNPVNVNNLKQVGRSLYLMGKHAAACDVYDEAQQIAGDDWEIWHNKGLCYVHLKQYETAIDSFQKANSIQRHDVTYRQLGHVYFLQEKFEAAIDVYQEALDFSPENPELLTTIGLLFLRTGDDEEAFKYLGNSLTQDPRNPRTILAACSVIQDHGDMDTALVKYRVPAVHTPNSPQLWSNIGMCYFGQGNLVAAGACLRRALYLAPFEFIICYNLGLVNLQAQLYASAFHYLSAARSLKPDFPDTYNCLGVCLDHLEDFDNACRAFERSLSLKVDHVTELNFAVTLANHGDKKAAKGHFGKFNKIWATLDEATKRQDKDIAQRRSQLEKKLK